MTPRQKRFALVAVGLLALGAVSALVFYAMRSNLMFFYSPSDVAQGKAPQGHSFRLGGLVEKGSLVRQSDGLTVHFVLTDLKQRITVSYLGILPDMFREGQGAIAQGRLGGDGLFVATEVLAKHDEKYMPPEVADALKRAGKDPSKSEHPGGMPGGTPGGPNPPAAPGTPENGGAL